MAPSDPYTAKAEQDASVDQKKSELQSIVKESKFAMLTSRDTDGALHSRAMSPASHQGLVFTFVANRESGKFDELANDPNVNVSFSDPSSSDWASVAGTAKINTDVEAIKKVWNPLLKSWFGEIDENHKVSFPINEGEPGDERIALIEVVPTEIRYWLKTRTSIGQTFEVVKGALTGETAAPGALRTITASELELARKVENKQI
ncbi:uncharacterized protein JCM6883_003027 [Sporobolomyces salmoneus]|uniref:uncharacterized protein n=1 Tax=Sporobolomyces salmoneus TaxID=183962 RepID=UPI00316F6C76